MLTTMDTLTPRDMEEWARLNRYDTALGASPALAHKTQQAIHEIQEFTTTHSDAVASTSWGKDSIVIAHLTRIASPDTPLLWIPTIRSDGTSYEAKATYTVRDTFLHTFPGPYEERPATARNPKRGDPNYRSDQYDHPDYISQDVLKENNASPYISGVRAEESSIRAQSRKWHGISTNRTCRPIIDWKTTDIFAYIAVHNLPIHPAYAATHGGALDRRWIRVHPLRSKAPERSAIYGRDMDDWEDKYFPRLCRHTPYQVGV